MSASTYSVVKFFSGARVTHRLEIDQVRAVENASIE